MPYNGVSVFAGYTGSAWETQNPAFPKDGGQRALCRAKEKNKIIFYCNSNPNIVKSRE